MATHASTYILPNDFARVEATVTTNASGAASETIGPFTGWLDLVNFTLGTLTSGAADVTITVTSSGETVYAVTNASANKLTRPKILNQDTAGSNLTAIYTRYALVNDTLTVTVAQGGDTKACTVEVTVTPN